MEDVRDWNSMHRICLLKGIGTQSVVLDSSLCEEECFRRRWDGLESKGRLSIVGQFGSGASVCMSSSPFSPVQAGPRGSARTRVSTIARLGGVNMSILCSQYDVFLCFIGQALDEHQAELCLSLEFRKGWRIELRMRIRWRLVVISEVGEGGRGRSG